jgi:hypothetical protein
VSKLGLKLDEPSCSDISFSHHPPAPQECGASIINQQSSISPSSPNGPQSSACTSSHRPTGKALTGWPKGNPVPALAGIAQLAQPSPAGPWANFISHLPPYGPRNFISLFSSHPLGFLFRNSSRQSKWRRRTHLFPFSFQNLNFQLFSLPLRSQASGLSFSSSPLLSAFNPSPSRPIQNPTSNIQN